MVNQRLLGEVAAKFAMCGISPGWSLHPAFYKYSKSGKSGKLDKLGKSGKSGKGASRVRQGTKSA